MSDVKPIDHRVHIRGSDGQIIREQHYALHIVNGNKFYNRPPLSDKFYTEGGHKVELKDVPEVCKRHLVEGSTQNVAQEASSKFLGKKPNKKGSGPEADSLV